MTRSRSLCAVLVAAGVLGGGALAAPAEAGGRLSWTYAPTDRERAGALATGLQLYSVFNELRAADIRQKGRNNRAGLSQHGRGNLGLVQQRGDDHAATLEQNGRDNAYGLFQFGRGSEDHVVQEGDGGAGTTFSYGW